MRNFKWSASEMFAFTLWVFSVLCCNARNTITVENKHKGVVKWFHTQEDLFTKLQINGFTTKISYFPGEVVQFKLSSKSWAEAYKIEVYRLGYYKGSGARRLGVIYMTADEKKIKDPSNTFLIQEQPSCLFDKRNRLKDYSNWHNSSQWTIPVDAVSGVYVALPIFDNKKQKYYGSYIPFVVRKVLHAGVKEDMLFKTADMTWQAYNRFGDYNVYRGGEDPWAFPETRAYKASYNRPYQNRMANPFGSMVSFIFGAEYPMIFWLEKHGYDVSYCASQDVETMHQDGTLLNYKTILSVGHDEYWTGAMKAAHEYARDHGVHLAFFSGNEVFWRTVWEENTLRSRQHGGPFLTDTKTNRTVPLEPKRVFVCRKETYDGVPAATPDEWTGTFRDPRFRRAEPESLLTGQNFMVNGVRHDAMTVTAEDAELRFWRHASFVRSAREARKKQRTSKVVYKSSTGLLGYEWDEFPVNSGRHPGLIPLSTTTLYVEEKLAENFGATYNGSGTVTHRLSLYRRYNYGAADLPAKRKRWTFETACASPDKMRRPPPQSTSLVFGAGTVQWSWALSDKHDGPKVRPDRDIQQATLNIFADMGVFPGSFKADMTPPLVLPITSTDTFPPTSVITAAHQTIAPKKARNIIVEVEGHAQDDERGGGAVAAVEVSVDGGRTWAMATGRRHWHHTFVLKRSQLGELSANATKSSHDHSGAVPWLRNSMLRANGLYCVQQAAGASKPPVQQCSLLVLSRAVDDSGWMESGEALIGLCALKAGQRSLAGGRHALSGDANAPAPNARIVDIMM